MDPRKTSISRSVFYRGISLKEYVRKSSVTEKPLEYKDDQTILLDEHQNPIIIHDNFIITEPSRPKGRKTEADFTITPTLQLPTQKSNLELPSLRSDKIMKLHTKSFAGDRHSTDTSFGNSFEANLSLLPNIEKKQPTERNATMSSRCGSKSVSCRKKLAEVIQQQQEMPNAPKHEKEKLLSSKQYLDFLKKQMMLNRYNLGGKGKLVNKKPRYYERVKSFAQ